MPEPDDEVLAAGEEELALPEVEPELLVPVAFEDCAVVVFVFTTVAACPVTSSAKITVQAARNTAMPIATTRFLILR